MKKLTHIPTTMAVRTSAQHIDVALHKTDWGALAEQKLALVEEIAVCNKQLKMLLDGAPDDPDLEDAATNLRQNIERLDGLLHWIDALQDAAHDDGYPVVFLTEEN